MLKSAMERFGRIDLCFMGNRNKDELPMVRFATVAAAENAMQAISAGTVAFDGVTVKAEFKKGPLESLQRCDHGYTETTSRDLVRSSYDREVRY